jgi:hypothetical protein
VAPLPLHTDGAHHPLPPRFILLACVMPGSQPVSIVIVRFRDAEFDESAIDYESDEEAVDAFYVAEEFQCPSCHRKRGSASVNLTTGTIRFLTAKQA